ASPARRPPPAGGHPRPGAPPAAPRQRVDDHCTTVERREERLCFAEGYCMVEPADHGHIGRDRSLAGADLVANELEMGDIGSNEGQPCIAAGLGEGSTLCEKAIAGMDRVTAGSICDLNDRAPVQVSGCAATWQRPSLICHAQVQTVRVVLRMHGN